MSGTEEGLKILVCVVINVVDIISFLVEIGLSALPKSWKLSTPYPYLSPPTHSAVPGMYSYFTNMHSVDSDKRK